MNTQDVRQQAAIKILAQIAAEFRPVESAEAEAAFARSVLEDAELHDRPFFQGVVTALDAKATSAREHYERRWYHLIAWLRTLEPGYHGDDPLGEEYVDFTARYFTKAGNPFDFEPMGYRAFWDNWHELQALHKQMDEQGASTELINQACAIEEAFLF